MTTPLIIENLTVLAGSTMLVRGVSMTVRAGHPLTILGETGSGKSLVAEAAMGTLAPELAAQGRVVLHGTACEAGDTAARQRQWGRRIAMLPQEPWLALDPTMRAQAQVAEVHALLHGRADATARAMADLTALGLEDARGRYPFQLSGGMAQRVALAATLAGGAPVLIADEPTKGLDADMIDAVTALLLGVVEAGGALLTITHDIALARALGGDLMVMLEGRVVEQGPAAQVLAAPQHDYTRRLLQADPATWDAAAPAIAGSTVLEGRSLGLSLGGRDLFRNLDITVGAGDWVAVTGPSGCGKTSLGNVLLGLRRAEQGRVTRARNLAPLRFQKLYQDPVAAFFPSQVLGQAMQDLLRQHGLPEDRLIALLKQLRLPPSLLARLPGQVSGGELQRLALARVLLVEPAFLFADEPTSRLDPLTQQDVMMLLRDVSAERRMAILLVTHDHALARAMASRRLDMGMPSLSSHAA
jgi:peptide/nickel transport system ATP-binding protein